MRVLFATWAEPTHLYSMVPLAWACHAAGHEVRVAAPPTCIAGVARTGLIGVPVGRDVALDQIRNRADLAPWRSPVRWPRGWAADPDLLDAGQHRVLEALADKQCLVADAMAGDLIDFAQSWRPDVIVHDTLTFAGVVAASVLGVPSFAHTWGSSTVIRVEMAGLGSRPRPEYLELLERFGASPEAEPVGWFDPCPPTLRLADPAPRHRIPIRYTPFNGPGVLPEWLAREPTAPRVCLTGGISGSKTRPGEVPELFSRTLEGLAERDIEVVVAVGPGGAAAFGDQPANVRVVESLPMSALLPTCSAVVHHGGSGTGLTGVVAGVPQLVLPQIPVAAEIGERLEDCGAGLILDPVAQHDPDAIRAAVDRLLDDGRFRKAAADLRDEVAGEPSPADRVAVLEAAAGR